MATSAEPTLLEARYGKALPYTEATTDAVLTTLLAHKSVRNFRPDALPPGTLECIVAAAQSAATSSNLQTWSVVAVREAERKTQASLLCGDQAFIRQAPLFLLFCADLSRLHYVSEQTDLPGEGLDYLEMFLTAAIDASLAAQNAAIAAESMGLGICYVGGARNRPRELAALLQLPPRVFVVFGMAVGFPATSDTSAIKPRLPQAAVLHDETYSEANREAAIASYDATMQAFYEAQNMDVKGNWSRHSAKRVAGPDALSGRHILRDILNELGFALK